MNKITTLIIVFFTLSYYQAQSEIYIDSLFENTNWESKKVAILPFHATAEYSEMVQKNMDEAKLQEIQNKISTDLRRALHFWIEKRKDSKDILVSVQSLSETNALLESASVNSENIATFSTEEIQNILRVDAVISGNYSIKQFNPIATGLAVVIGAYYVPEHKGILKLEVRGLNENKPIFVYYKELNKGFGSDNDGMIDALMRKTSRQLGRYNF